MATYTYQFHTLYDPATGNWQNLSDTGTGTLSDGDGVGVGDFEVGPPSESITGGTANDTDYLGTVEVDGFTFIAVQNITGLGPRVSLYGQDGAPSFATAFGTLDPAPQVNPVDFTTCFAPGTMIATPNGEIEVEKFAVGDVIRTNDHRFVPIKWIGRQTVHTMFRPAERLMPVRFMAGSLGNGLPHTDLTVTADHAMLVEGVLCNASALVNGGTITRVPLAEMGETFTVYHIETEEHEIILANGAPAETFIDNVSRSVFDNFAEYEELYGDTPEMTELPYPRAMSARQVPSHIRAKLGLTKAA